jgi:hypothetical protein
LKLYQLVHYFSWFPGVRKKLVSQFSWKNTWSFTQGHKFIAERVIFVSIPNTPRH